MPAETTAERRSIVVAGAAFFGVLVLLVLVAIVFAGDAGDERTSGTTIACTPQDTACLAAQREGERPGIIPRPGEGRAPSEPGDRGGWEQIAVLGALVVALATIAALVVRSSRRSRRRAATPPAPGAEDDDRERALAGPPDGTAPRPRP